VKGYLNTRGVEFVAINVQEDPDAASELEGLGARSLPVVTVGDRFSVGIDLSELDRLLGLADSGPRLLPWSDLVDRAPHLLDVAVRYARQLPADHYEDPIPGLEDLKLPLVLPDGTPLLRPDGTPYIPHRHYVGLVRHIVGHGAKFERMATDPGVDITDTVSFVLLGEPEDDEPLEDVFADAEQIVAAIRRRWPPGVEPDLARVMNTFSGPQSLHQMLHATVYSLTQHTRQLMTVLEMLGVEPDGPLGGNDYAGLELPVGVWK
jgi:glutaredoxin